MLIAAASAIEAPLLARRLDQLGRANPHHSRDLDAAAAEAMQHWDAILVDHALGLEACRRLAAAAACTVARRIVLITPAERHELPALQAAGFTGYLVKPIRVASLAAQLGGEAPGVAPDGFARADSRDQAPTVAPSGTGALTILVAEDNEINALLARALLTRLGHRPTVAPNGAAALEAWLAARARRNAVRSGAHGRAHAGERRHRGDAPHPRGRSRRSPHPDHRADRGCARARIAPPASTPAWTAF